jgi:hypothetical protein
MIKFRNCLLYIKIANNTIADVTMRQPINSNALKSLRNFQ